MAESTSRCPAYARLLDCAAHILVVCDHSERELRHKLAAPIMGKNGPEGTGATAEDYERVITWCHEHDYLDDSRFIAHFIASHSRKGYGPTRIRQELNQKGISREATGKAVREYNIDWCAPAHDQATRRYGEPLLTVLPERIKIQRFLLYRGYLMGDIQEIWRNFVD